MVGAQNTGLGGLSAQSLSSLLENLQKTMVFAVGKIGVGVRVGAQNTGLGDGSGQSLSSRWEKYSKTKNGFLR